MEEVHSIATYSTQWGQSAADRYLDAIQAALRRLCELPGLLQRLPDFHASLQFYRVNQHVLVCDVEATSIVVLSVLSASMDIPSRLAELEPILAADVELLHRAHRSNAGNQP